MTDNNADSNTDLTYQSRVSLPVIRHATFEDAEQIAYLGCMFHEQAFGNDILEYDIDDCIVSLEGFIGQPNFICMVADVGGRFVSFGSLILSPVYFNHSHISCEELFWWADPESNYPGIGMKLKKRMEEEAKKRGAESIQMKSISALNGERMANLYIRNGYKPCEQSFIKRLV
jgi:hypothetical protein